MIARFARWASTGVVLLCVAGCASTFEGRFDPALFPRPSAAPVVKDAMPVVLRLEDGARDHVMIGPMTKNFTAKVNLPIGRIVEAAALAALAREFTSVAQSGGNDDMLAVRLEVGAIRFNYRDDLIYFIPLGPLLFERIDLSARLEFEVRVLDALSAILWSRSYDSGHDLWKPKPRAFGLGSDELPGAGVQRLAHEQASRLMMRAAHDVRQWIDSERLRERAL